MQRHTAGFAVLEAGGVAQPSPPAVRPIIGDAQKRLFGNEEAVGGVRVRG